MSTARLRARRFLLARRAPASNLNKKQGATGITTVAPYVTGQWGRGEDRLLE
jgi:hypothetical protein